MRFGCNRLWVWTATVLLSGVALLHADISSAIVIRHDVPDAEYRELAEEYVASVVYLDGCAGTLIEQRWAVTAAHCLEGVGSQYLEAQHLGQFYRIERYFMHPDFEDGGAKDIALIQFRDPIAAGRPAELYDREDEAGQQVVFVGRGGYGTGEAGLIEDDGMTRAATNTVEDVDENWIIFTFNEPEDATSYEGISGPGDSGGPAFIELGNGLYLAGVSAWQDNNHVGGVNGVYGVLEYYTRVSSVVNWIRSTIDATPLPKVTEHKLIDAIRANDMAAIEGVLNEDPGVLQDTEILTEVFYQTLQGGQVAIAELLIGRGAEFTSVRYSNLSLYGLAFERRSTEYFDMLLRQDVAVDDSDYPAIPILWMAILRHRENPDVLEIASALLDRGAAPNAQTYLGEHALHEAALSGNLAITQLLVERGADPDLANNNGSTALMDAAASGHSEIVQYLLDAGADPMLTDKGNRTALDLALERDQFEVVRLLQAHAEGG